ncbi:hypothetical protein [Dickeya lacustris]|uniref:Acid shock protein n=1 Tax=Dickeya lacustris TaxID=2259638 RepID=A0ABY8G742_9GAMM|nr:hypothetical protein [Dickeya lacustris]WFN55689.1 hypothetical protein O1Q98_19320 [Dickeya lacustris]
MNMKPLLLGVILATSYAHAASTEVNAKPAVESAASAVVTSKNTANEAVKSQPVAPVKKEADKSAVVEKALKAEKENKAAIKALKKESPAKTVAAEKNTTGTEKSAVEKTAVEKAVPVAGKTAVPVEKNASPEVKTEQKTQQ